MKLSVDALIVSNSYQLFNRRSLFELKIPILDRCCIFGSFLFTFARTSSVSQFMIDPFTSVLSNKWPAGRMWPARGSNAAREHQEKLRFHKKYWFYWSISQKDSVLTQIFFLILIMQDLAFRLMRPVRHFEFETPALRYDQLASYPG